MLSKLIEYGPGMKTVSLPRSQTCLHVMPTSTGYEIQENCHYWWDGQQRGNTPFTVLQHTISGRGSLRYENRQMKLHGGEALLLIVPHNHCYWLDHGDRWEYFWISMNGIEALRIHEMVQNAQGPVLKLKKKTVDSLADCALRLMQDDEMTPGKASSIAYEASMYLFDDVFGPSERINKERGTINRAVQYIHQNLSAEIDVETLAEIAGLSRAHFSRSFALLTGMPPAKFVQHLRMLRAARLLIANREMSIKQVSSLCGIAECNYFSKSFRKAYGISPTEFRTNGMYASPSNQTGMENDAE